MKKRINKCAILFVIIGFTIVTLVVILGLSDSDTHKVKTKCYDKYGSEINGVTCYKDTLTNPMTEVISNIVLPICFILFLISMLGMIIEDAT